MKLKLPDGPFKAYLFDCDGTIVDSMPLHYVAWNEVLAPYGCAFPEERRALFRRRFGTALKAVRE